MTKIIVATGGHDEESVEIVNLDEENQDLICDDLLSLQIGTFGATGQILGKTPVICGGIGHADRCQAFENGLWSFIPNPTQLRFSAKSAILTNTDGNDALFIAGGHNNETSLDGAEIFNGTTWINNEIQNLPISLKAHCFVKVNLSTLFSIGGENETHWLKNTYFYNFEANKWTAGPFLNKERTHFSCGILRWKNPETNSSEKIIVAAGGFYDNSHLESVELLYLNSDDSVRGEWVKGPELPKPVTGSTMIEYNNSVILIGGGSFADDDFRQMYQLSSPNGPWIKTRQTLKKERAAHVSFLVPDELVNCHY